MAMVRVNPVQVEVRTGWLDGQPREIQFGEERFRVARIVRVRQEKAAYAVTVGPRTVFEVVAERGATLTLSFRHRSRRWTIEGLDDRSVDRSPVLAPLLGFVPA